MLRNFISRTAPTTVFRPIGAVRMMGGGPNKTNQGTQANKESDKEKKLDAAAKAAAERDMKDPKKKARDDVVGEFVRDIKEGQ